MTAVDVPSATPPVDLDELLGRSPQQGLPLAAKRVVDVVGSATLLALLSPVFAVITVAVRRDTPGPAIFVQTRVGRGGRLIRVHKFRSMHEGASSEAHRRYLLSLLRGEDPGGDAEVFKVAHDPRVTRVGRFLRRTSLDELPQLLDVLRGEMSLVGPRPDVTYALDGYRPEHWERFCVLPGMTGLWQVSGRSALSPLEMLELDVRYARSWSFTGDLRVLWRTAGTLLAGVAA